MKQFIFLTNEGNTTSPNDTDVENIQVLGIESGKDEKTALTKLLKENKWIKKAGFKTDEIFSRELVSL